MKITNLDKTSLNSLRSPIEQELAALGERLGLKFELGNGTYNQTGADASFKLKITVDDPAKKEAAARAVWDATCRYIGIDYARPDETGLRPEDFGTEFVSRGVTYRAVGIAQGRSKYPIMAEILTGPKKGKITCFNEVAVPLIRLETDQKAKA